LKLFESIFSTILLRKEVGSDSKVSFFFIHIFLYLKVSISLLINVGNNQFLKEFLHLF
jgi:hypothetical protein